MGNKKTKDCYLFGYVGKTTHAKGFYTAASSSCNVAYSQAIAGGTHQASYPNSPQGECCYKCKYANAQNENKVCDQWQFNTATKQCDLYRSVTKYISHSGYVRGSSGPTQHYPKNPMLYWEAS